MRFEDKVTLITGAGAGIGKAIAVKFGKEGAKLVINDINAETGQAVVDEIKAGDGMATFIQGDTSDPADVEKMMKCTTDTYGRLDVLVNNAGVEELAPFHMVTKQQWDRVIGITLTGTFMVAQGAVNQMLTQGGGVIVNIASLGGLIGFPMFSAYVAAKHGVVGLTKTMALELREQNIRVNAVCPAFIQTSMADRAYEFFEGAGVPIHEMLAQYQGHVGTVEEVANLAAYLASDESTFINGAAIPIDNAAHAN